MATKKQIKEFENKTMNEENVEEFIIDALKSYAKKNMLVDRMFWGSASGMLKNKIRKDTAKEIFDELHKHGFYNLICNYYDVKELKELERKFGVE